jgi:hypothetical protein
VACTKTGSKNDLFLNCRRKPKELSKKELSNVAPASFPRFNSIRNTTCRNDVNLKINQEENGVKFTCIENELNKSFPTVQNLAFKKTNVCQQFFIRNVSL